MFWMEGDWAMILTLFQLYNIAKFIYPWKSFKTQSLSLFSLSTFNAVQGKGKIIMLCLLIFLSHKSKSI